jgi:hypothetical protein
MSKPVILCVDDERMVLHSLRTQLAAAFGMPTSMKGLRMLRRL